jgi:hypothetical protein
MLLASSMVPNMGPQSYQYLLCVQPPWLQDRQPVYCSLSASQLSLPDAPVSGTPYEQSNTSGAEQPAMHEGGQATIRECFLEQPSSAQLSPTGPAAGFKSPMQARRRVGSSRFLPLSVNSHVQTSSLAMLAAVKHTPDTSLMVSKGAGKRQTLPVDSIGASRDESSDARQVVLRHSADVPLHTGMPENLHLNAQRYAHFYTATCLSILSAR